MKQCTIKIKMYKILEKLTLWKTKSGFYSTEEEQAYKEVRDWIFDIIEEKQNSKLIVCSASTNGKTKSGLAQKLKYKIHDEIEEKQRKPKFTPPKQNPNTTKYERCLNCKHHYTNTDSSCMWECTLKSVNGLSIDGYCDEFEPR